MPIETDDIAIAAIELIRATLRHLARDRVLNEESLQAVFGSAHEQVIPNQSAAMEIDRVWGGVRRFLPRETDEP